MTEQRSRLETALKTLAQGKKGEDEAILAQLTRRSDADDESLRAELRALRLFSIESGLFLGAVADDARRDEMLGALYNPMIKDARNDPDLQASVDFAGLKSRVELYRAFLASDEGPHKSPQDLLQKIGQHFANSCKTGDPAVANVGSAVFVNVCRQAKRLAEAEATRKRTTST